MDLEAQNYLVGSFRDPPLSALWLNHFISLT